jgi:hypothetical protein
MIVSLYTKGTLVGVMNEQFNLIKIQEINTVKKRTDMFKIGGFFTSWQDTSC